MKRHNRVAALFIFAVGLACVLYASFVLRLGNLHRPDSGFMPAVAGVCMAAFALAWFLTNLGQDENPQPLWAQGQWKRPLTSLVLMVLYALTMEWIGYILSTLLFLLGWQFLVEREKWWKGMTVSVLSTAGVYVLFVYLLRVPVPAGTLFR